MKALCALIALPLLAGCPDHNHSSGSQLGTPVGKSSVAAPEFSGTEAVVGLTLLAGLLAIIAGCKKPSTLPPPDRAARRDSYDEHTEG